MGTTVKTFALSLLLALAGATSQAQPAGAPPPLPGFPALPPRTNRAAAANATNLIPPRTARTNAPGSFSNSGATTNPPGANAAAAATLAVPPTVLPGNPPPGNVIVPGNPATPQNPQAFGAAAAPTPTPFPAPAVTAAPGAGAVKPGAPEELLPPGLIKFQDADVVQVLEF